MRSQHEQGVEPSSRLVDTLGDEVGGIRLLELLHVLEGDMRLGVRHASRLEPAVEHFFNSLQIAFALLRGDGDVVDALSMQVGDVVVARELLQLLNRADANDLQQGSAKTPLEMYCIKPTSSKSALAHSGIGVPQYRFLDMFQSRALAIQFPNLPSPTLAGTL